LKFIEKESIVIIIIIPIDSAGLGKVWVEHHLEHRPQPKERRGCIPHQLNHWMFTHRNASFAGGWKVCWQLSQFDN
jgi:hypothetical protein